MSESHCSLKTRVYISEYITNCFAVVCNSYVFWFGDLNFRLTDEEELSHADIKRLVEQDHLDQLIQRDQLSMIRRQGRAFTRLEERLPAFPPTFKFEHGTSDYDPK